MTQIASNSPPAGQDQSKTEAAKNAAADVASGAREATASVAQTATDQVKDVASTTKSQARDLLGEGRSQLQEQARKTQSSAASSLGSLAQELRRMSDNSDSSSTAGELVRQASDRAQGLASWLQQREPGDALEEVRAFARRKPGLFLLGAALAGVAAGRLTRGAVAAAHDSQSASHPATSDVSAGAPMQPASPFPEVPHAAEPVTPVLPAAQPVDPLGEWSAPGQPAGPSSGSAL